MADHNKTYWTCANIFDARGRKMITGDGRVFWLDLRAGGWEALGVEGLDVGSMCALLNATGAELFNGFDLGGDRRFRWADGRQVAEIF